MDLESAVHDAVEWAFEGESLHAAALAALAESLARDIANPVVMKAGTPPAAALSKELRATLEDLEGLRDGDDADASLGLVLSSPVWDAEKPGEAKPRSSRRQSVGEPEEAVDVVAKSRRGRGVGASA